MFNGYFLDRFNESREAVGTFGDWADGVREQGRQPRLDRDGGAADGLGRQPGAGGRGERAEGLWGAPVFSFGPPSSAASCQSTLTLPEGHHSSTLGPRGMSPPPHTYTGSPV